MNRDTVRVRQRHTQRDTHTLRETERQRDREQAQGQNTLLLCPFCWDMHTTTYVLNIYNIKVVHSEVSHIRTQMEYAI